MPSNSELGQRLVAYRVLTAEQWSSVPNQSGKLSDILSYLRTLKAWWNPHLPAVSSYQCKKIEEQAEVGYRDLDRELLLNQYLILDELLGGGMGVVHRAWSFDENKYKGFVAIKRLKGDDPELRERQHREARILRRLDHSGIPKLIEFDRIQGGRGQFMAMEFVPGRNLSKYVDAQGVIPASLAHRWALELLSILEYTHQNGVLHRDIKPENIVIIPTAIPSLKLLDFGLAKEEGQDDEEGYEQLTRTSQAMGTPRYMAPEQFDETRGVTEAADLYSLGCVFYFMLTGAPPFEETKYYELLLKHLKSPAPPIPEKFNVPKALRDVVARMLLKEPKQRGSIQELRAILEGRSASKVAAISAADSPAAKVGNASRSVPPSVQQQVVESRKMAAAITDEYRDSAALETPRYGSTIQGGQLKGGVVPLPRSHSVGTSSQSSSPADLRNSTPGGVALAVEPDLPVAVSRTSGASKSLALPQRGGDAFDGPAENWFATRLPQSPISALPSRYLELEVSRFDLLAILLESGLSFRGAMILAGVGTVLAFLIRQLSWSM